MARRWTAEQRAQQSEAIRRWKPWERSTGPKTDTGKATVSANALKHGLRSAGWLEDQKRITELLRRCRELLKRI